MSVIKTRNEKRFRRFLLLLFLLYLYTVIWFTVLRRSTSYEAAEFELFWSYKEWLTGNGELGREILANMVMFVPFGFLLSVLLPTLRRRRRIVVVFVAALFFSLTIEALQLFLMRGLFEWDDLVSNTAGALAGAFLYGIAEKLLRKRRHLKIFTLLAAIASAGICLAVIVDGRGAIGVDADASSRGYCFQIDEADVSEGVMTLRGFAFRYEHPDGSFSLFLRRTGDRVFGKSGTAMEISFGISRRDVNGYFQ
ncbi:MAG: VanZ family protein, partial [Eubacterium sp.]|nr:VanZ family protein [Eubacterium sp.]